MKIGFTGHRNRTWDETFLVELAAKYPDATWIHGAAKDGFDHQVDTVAKRLGVKLDPCPPEGWGTPALMARNRKVVDKSDVIVAGYDGRVKGGTFSTMNYARFRQKKVIELAPDTVYHVEGLI